MAEIDNLNFKVILDDDSFSKQIQKDIEIAEKFNTSVSRLLDIKDSIKGLEVNIQTDRAVDSLENLNKYFRKLEDADWSKVGDTLNLRPQVERCIMQLRELEEKIEVIQQIRPEEGGGGVKLAESYRQATATAKGLLDTISQLRSVEVSLNSPSRFDAYIRSLTEVNFELMQMREYYKSEEAVAKRIQKEKEAEAKAHDKLAEAMRKENEQRRKAAHNQMQGEFEEYVQSLTKVNDELQSMNEYYRQLEKESNKTQENTEKLNFSLKTQERVMRGLKNLAASYLSVYGAERLLKNIIQITGEVEMQKTTLRAILQDASQADAVFEKIKSLAVVSPFTFKDLVSYTKQLSAFSVPVGELYDTTKMLADVSAGLGVGMDRIILAYGQIRSAAFLRGQETRQLTESGIPILTELQKQFKAMGEVGITVGEVFDKISARQVPFEMVAKVFKEMTSEGGKFYKMQEVQSETLKGKISNLADAYQLMFSEIGDRLNPALKAGADILRDMATNYTDVGRELLMLVSTFGALRVILPLIAGDFALIKKAVVSLKKAGSALYANPYIALAAALAILATKAYSAATALSDAEKTQRDYNNSVKEYNTTVRTETAVLKGYIDRVKSATEGTKEYDAAKRALNSRYGEYIEQLKSEGVAVNNLSALYEGLKNKIAAAARERFIDKASRGLEENFGSALDNLDKQFDNIVKTYQRNNKKAQNRITESGKSVLYDYIFGAIDLEDVKKNSEAAAAYAVSGMKINIEKLRENYAAAAEVYEKGTARLRDIASKAKKSDSGDNIERAEVEIIRGVIAKYADLASAQSLVMGQTEEHDEYVQRLIQRYGELGDILSRNTKDITGQNGALKKERALIEEIMSAIGGGSLSKGGNSAGSGSDAVLSILRNRISEIQRLRGVYESLAKTMSQADIQKYFPDVFKDGFNFKGQIDNILSEMDKLGTEGKAAADKIRIDIKLKDVETAAKNAADIAKRTREWEEMILGLKEEQMSVEDKIAAIERKRNELLAETEYGSEDYNTILRAYNEQIEKLREKLYEISQIQTTDFWRNLLGVDDDYTLKQMRAIRDEAEALIGIVKNLDASKVVKNGSGMVKAYTLSRADFGTNTSLADSLGLTDDNKTIQMTTRDFEELLKAVKKVESEMSDKGPIVTFVEMIKKGGYTADEFSESLTSALQQIKRVQPALNKLGELFGAMGDTAMEKRISTISSIFGTMADSAIKFASGDMLGGSLSLIEGSLDILIDIVATTYQEKQALHEASLEAESLQRQLALANGVDTFFGTNWLKSLSNTLSNVKAYQEKVSEITKMILGGAEFAKFSWFKGSQFYAITDILDEIGFSDYLDELGLIRKEALEALSVAAAQYMKDDEQRVKEWIDVVDKYKESLEELSSITKELFGDMADNLTDSMIDAFVQAGDAAAGLADNIETIFGDLGTAIAKNLISSFVIENVLNKYKNDVEGLFAQMGLGADPEWIASKLATLADSISKDADVAAEFSNKLLTAMQNAGIQLSQSDTSASGLSNGIKSITEDTANLLASYVNAIRADVSASRVSISDIQQTNLRIAVASESILARLNDTIGAFSGGGDGFKIIMS